jgi:carbon monoxide dehydrogenase subunit G
MDERIETTRRIDATPAQVFALLCDPQGHVAIDASGMLQDAEGDPVSAVGDSFVVHMDRESLGDIDWGEYDVTISISRYEQDREIAWDVLGRLRPQIGHFYCYRLEPDEEATLVTSYYDWSQIHDDYRGKVDFPIISESSLKATLGILDRTVRRGYPRSA